MSLLSLLNTICNNQVDNYLQVEIMKKRLLFLLILFSNPNLKAQEYVQFGAKGGVNFYNMSSKYETDNRLQTGFHLGLLAEIFVSNKFSIQPEVLYSNQGKKEGVELDHSPGGYPEWKFDYIQAPLLAKFYIIPSLSLEIGPSFNFLVEQEISGIKTDWGSSFELGGAIGTSYKIRGGFFGSARFIYGFTDAVEKKYEREDYNYGLQIGLGYML